MKSIKEKAKEFYPDHCNAYTDARNKDKRIGFEAGANYVLDAIEAFMANLYFGSNDAEMFYKDIKANIHKFIKQLKEK